MHVIDGQMGLSDLCCSAVRSKAVILLLLIHCLLLLPLWGFFVCSLFCNAILCVLTSFAIKRVGCFALIVMGAVIEG